MTSSTGNRRRRLSALFRTATPTSTTPPPTATSSAPSPCFARTANPNLPDENGNTPLHNAAYVNATEITERLLDAQADPNAVNRDGNTPLHIAIHFSGEGDYDATIRRLLDAGTDLDLRNSLDGYTPLHVAVREDFHGTAEELLRRGR